MRISAKHVSAAIKREAMTLYGPSSQRVRLEWITESGGVFNAPHDVYVDPVKTPNVSDNVPGIWGPVMRDQRERITLADLALSIDQLGFWYFANDLNLANRKELVILQHVRDQYYTGAGTGLATVWTPDVAPSWTVDEWIGYWLVFSDRRFKVLSNAMLDVTVDLGVDGILPTGSTTAELQQLIEWYPVRDDLAVSAGAMSPLNEIAIFQSVFVSRIPAVA